MKIKPLILFATSFTGIICCEVGALKLTLPKPNLGLSAQIIRGIRQVHSQNFRQLSFLLWEILRHKVTFLKTEQVIMLRCSPSYLVKIREKSIFMPGNVPFDPKLYPPCA